MESTPDVAIMMIGTNDNQEWWNPEIFERDYLELASRIKNLTSKPDLFIMTSPPMSPTYGNKTHLSQKLHIVNELIPSLVQKVANQLNVDSAHTIDLFNIMGGQNQRNEELFCDGLHMNLAGNTYAASQIFLKLRDAGHIELTK